ncbi:MAG: hypothetical protein Kapaf2KO_15040 [Candidatus Kapaibacteriales bacterium]
MLRTLFRKILSVAAVILLGTLLIVLASLYAIDKKNEQIASQDIHAYLLEAQRSLSIFQNTKNLETVERLSELEGLINEKFEELDKSECALEIEALSIDFFKSFDRLISLVKERGINEDSGLQGSFRRDIHDVQDAFAELNNSIAQVKILEIRRREKDFMLRKDNKYFEQVSKDIIDLREHLKTINISTNQKRTLDSLLTAYINSFSKLVVATKGIAELSNNLNEYNKKLQTLSYEMTEEKAEMASLAQSGMVGLALIILVVSVWISLYLSKKISQPITQLKDAANELAKGNLDVNINSVVTEDEVQDLSVSFMYMVGQIKLRTDELVESNNQLIKLNKEINSQQEVLKLQAEEIKSNNITLGEQNSQLNNMIAEKNEFIGIVSHDLKNPLSAIRLAANLLMTDTSLTKDEVSEFSNDILISATRMFELIKNLLDANALEQGTVKVNLLNFDIGRVVNHSVESYKNKAAAKEINLHYELPENPIYAKGDSSLTHQILDNILSNAVKYSPYGKSITILIDKKGNGDMISVGVKDEGPGLSDEDQQKLFSKYTKLTPQPTGGEHSTGLGLSIVKKLVEMQEGRIWCESELGKGCAFWFSLPVANNIQ